MAATAAPHVHFLRLECDGKNEHDQLRFELQRAAAAFLAISLRFSGVNLSRRAAPPFRPSAWAPLSLPESPVSSSISPVRILATRTALATVSAGRFWPCGPLGIERDLHLLGVKHI